MTIRQAIEEGLRMEGLSEEEIRKRSKFADFKMPGHGNQEIPTSHYAALVRETRRTYRMTKHWNDEERAVAERILDMLQRPAVAQN